MLFSVPPNLGKRREWLTARFEVDAHLYLLTTQGSTAHRTMFERVLRASFATFVEKMALRDRWLTFRRHEHPILIGPLPHLDFERSPQGGDDRLPVSAPVPVDSAQTENLVDFIWKAPFVVQERRVEILVPRHTLTDAKKVDGQWIPTTAPSR